MAALGDGSAGAAERSLRIVALGDSLTAGYGLPAKDAFPVQLQRALAAKGVAVEIANAGVSGDTTTGGLARLDWSVPDGTDAVILELGANDALRGFDPAVARKALDAMLRRLTARKIPVLLCGMVAPRNLGAEYARAFGISAADSNGSASGARTSVTSAPPGPGCRSVPAGSRGRTPLRRCARSGRSPA